MNARKQSINWTPKNTKFKAHMKEIKLYGRADKLS